MPVNARSNVSDDCVVSPDRLVVVEQRFRVLQPELHEPPRCTFFFLFQKSHATNETSRLVKFDGIIEARLQQRVLVSYVVAPMATGFFDPQRIERVITGVSELKRLFCRQDLFVSRIGAPSM